jgi:hypothetical protein
MVCSLEPNCALPVNSTCSRTEPAGHHVSSTCSHTQARDAQLDRVESVSSTATYTEKTYRNSMMVLDRMINNIICPEGLKNPLEGQMHHTMLDLPLLKGILEQKCSSNMDCINKLTTANSKALSSPLLLNICTEI